MYSFPFCLFNCEFWRMQLNRATEPRKRDAHPAHRGGSCLPRQPGQKPWRAPGGNKFIGVVAPNPVPKLAIEYHVAAPRTGRTPDPP